VQDQVALLTRWLSNAGHDVYTVGPGEVGDELGDFEHRSVGDSRSLVVNGATVPLAMGRRVRSLTTAALTGADVVHVHEPFVPSVGTAALGGAKQPVVATFHADPARWTRRIYSLGSSVARRLVGRADAVTTVSPVSASAIESFTDYEIIPNAIDTSLYVAAVKVASQVMFLGRNDPRKGLHVLLEAWPLVKDACPEASLLANVESETPVSGVEFLGRVSEEAKQKLYAESEVFCAPNTGGESFGIAMAEGLAASCAVVASAIPAFVHVAGDAGIFVPVGDAPSLADALIRVIQDDTLRRVNQEAGAVRADRFSIDRVGPAYLETYERVLSG
jgi:phosphatidyl-myo-inositol alpha-mannosyltransferase